LPKKNINENHSLLNYSRFLTKSINKCLLFDHKKMITCIFEDFSNNRNRIQEHIRNSLNGKKKKIEESEKINNNNKLKIIIHKKNINVREKETFEKLIIFQKKLSTKKSCVETNYQETNTDQNTFLKSTKNIEEKFSYMVDSCVENCFNEENDKERIYELGKHLFKPLEDLEHKSAKDYYIVLDPLLRTNF